MSEEREFVECDACRSKPGMHRPCDGCAKNRMTIDILQKELAELKDQLELAAGRLQDANGGMLAMARLLV